MKDKAKQIKEMYKVSGYHKQFMILFIIIVGSAILDIITIPHIIRQMIDVDIPEHNIKALIIWGCIKRRKKMHKLRMIYRSNQTNKKRKF